MKSAKNKGIGPGRQWIPVPVDAIEAVMTAPTTKRRLWATAYLICWVVSFLCLLRGRPSTLRDLAAWSGSTTLSRASKARADARAAFEEWSTNETHSRQERDKNETEVSRNNHSYPAQTRQKRDKNETPRARAEITYTNTSYNSGSREEEVLVAFPTPPLSSPSGWDADLVLSCWRAAWPASGRGRAPEPSDRAKEKWLAHIASSLGDLSAEDFISALACWLEVQKDGRGKVFPPRGEQPSLGHVPSVYRKYLPGSPSRPRTASEREAERERQRLEDEAWERMTPDEQLRAF